MSGLDYRRQSTIDDHATNAKRRWGGLIPDQMQNLHTFF